LPVISRVDSVSTLHGLPGWADGPLADPMDCIEQPLTGLLADVGDPPWLVYPEYPEPVYNWTATDVCVKSWLTSLEANPVLKSV
jgi:hypothetical protein